MTREEREIALYCLKASSDYHSEVCEECIKYPNCDHTMQDDVTETIIKALEQEPFINKPCVSSGVCEYDKNKILDRIRAEIEQLSTNTKTNWDGCCPDIDYPEIEYVDVTKKQLLYIIDKYRAESEE